MNDFLRWCLKVLLNGTLWVFIFSINLGGRSFFDRASDVLVKNALVSAVDEELADLWQRVSKAAYMTFYESKAEADKAM